MKIQNLAIIFTLILVTISFALSIYTDAQIQALSLETSYDSRLQNATYDAISAFRINTANNSTSAIADSKLSNIEASINTFFELMDSSFRISGYTKENLKDFVPALVYTMYDGYYIYSPYSNVAITDTNGVTINPNESKNVQYGIKPYIYYSCRYKVNNNDFVITYSLDNYITIKGMVNGNYINDAGYLLTGEYDYIGKNNNKSEQLSEYIIVNGKGDTYAYIKLNGTKYYLDEDKNEIFYLLNGKRTVQTSASLNSTLFGKYYNLIKNNTLAKKYYTEAYDFTNRVLTTYKLKDLKASDAVDANGKNIFNNNNKIFDYDTKTQIEYSNSNFNTHRQAVIRYSIETNLSTAIAGFNKYSSSTNNFQMPVLKETEWDTIANNVCLISFMQGLSLGTKIYNGYSVIANSETEEVIRPGDIFIATKDNYYHSVTCDQLLKSYSEDKIDLGILDLDLKRQSVTQQDLITTLYYYPKPQLACYYCAINKNSNEYNDIYQYLNNLTDNSKSKNLKQIYYTALGRERAGTYKTENIFNIDDY